MKPGVLAAAVMLTIGATSCSDENARQYDISPIFPLTSDKCAQYNGEESGEGLSATCMVTKADCERAAADWRQAMSDGGVTDGILFTCD
jgi:hypothetical protein